MWERLHWRDRAALVKFLAAQPVARTEIRNLSPERSFFALAIVCIVFHSAVLTFRSGTLAKSRVLEVRTVRLWRRAVGARAGEVGTIMALGVRRGAAGRRNGPADVGERVDGQVGVVCGLATVRPDVQRLGGHPLGGE